MLAFLFFWGAFPQVEAPTGKLNLSLGVLVLGRLVRGRALLCTSRECSHLQPNPLHCPRGAPFPELLDILLHACLARSGGRPLGRLCETSLWTSLLDVSRTTTAITPCLPNETHERTKRNARTSERNETKRSQGFANERTSANTQPSSDFTASWVCDTSLELTNGTNEQY